MILTKKQLIETNLKGYKYFEMYEGYTRTGWGTIEDYFIVLEDDGENCVVADLKERDRTKKLSKTIVSAKIAKMPLLEWSEEKSMTINAIEKI